VSESNPHPHTPETLDLGETGPDPLAAEGTQSRVHHAGNHLELIIPISMQAGAKLMNVFADWMLDQGNHEHTSGGYCFICSQQVERYDGDRVGGS
jgi:hypothetical protein